MTESSDRPGHGADGTPVEGTNGAQDRAGAVGGARSMWNGDDQLKALGKLTAEFFFLALMLKMVVWALLDKSGRTIGMTLTSHLSFKRLCQAAGAIVTERMKNVPRAVEQFERILRRVRGIEDKRNRLVHSLWIVIPEDPSGLLSRIKFTRTGGRRPHRRPASGSGPSRGRDANGEG